MQAALRIDVSHPYRTPPELDARSLAIDHDDSVLGVMLLVIGGFRVATALAVGETWSAEPTIALLMVVCGLGLFLRRRRFAGEAVMQSLIAIVAVSLLAWLVVAIVAPQRL